MSANDETLRGIIEDDSKVISGLLEQLTSSVAHTLKMSGLSESDVEEVIMDAMVIFIKKVKSGEYTNQGVPIMAYLIKIARYRGQYYYRIKAANPEIPTEELDTWKGREKVELERWDVVKRALSELPDAQRRLMELTYIEGYRDKEIIDAGLSEYTTISSLKSQRYKAIRSLNRIVQKLTKNPEEQLREKNDLL